MKSELPRRAQMVQALSHGDKCAQKSSHAGSFVQRRLTAILDSGGLSYSINSSIERVRSVSGLNPSAPIRSIHLKCRNTLSRYAIEIPPVVRSQAI
jgi:hypothetical protein